MAADTPPAILGEVLPGSYGRFRVVDGSCQLAASNDHDAVLSWLRECAGESAATLGNYRKEAERLGLWASYRNQSISDLGRDDLVEYEKFLCSPTPRSLWIGPRKPRDDPSWKPFVGKLSKASRRQTFSVLGSLFTYLHETGYLRINPLAKSRLKKKRKKSAADIAVRSRYLPEATWQWLDDYYAGLNPKNHSEFVRLLRIRWVLRLFYETGARRSEIATATCADIRRDSRGKRWLKLLGKGEVERDVPVSDALIAFMGEYRASCGLSPTPGAEEVTALVLDLSGKAGIGDEAIYRIIKDACHKAADVLAVTDAERARALSTATTHWLRHSMATHKVNHGVDLRVMKDVLGHESLSTTMIYQHIERDAIHDAVVGDLPERSKKG